MIFYDLVVPATVGQWTAFVVSLAFAVVSFGMRFIVNLLAFWVLDWRGLLGLSSASHDRRIRVRRPARVLPRWLETVFTVLPWASMIQVPIDIFIGRRTGATLASGSRSRSVWASCCSGSVASCCRAPRVVVQGG